MINNSEPNNTLETTIVEQTPNWSLALSVRQGRRNRLQSSAMVGDGGGGDGGDGGDGGGGSGDGGDGGGGDGGGGGGDGS